MARETVIVCDRCEQRVPEEVVRTIEFKVPHDVRTIVHVFDLCEDCGNLFASMAWEPPSNGDRVRRLNELTQQVAWLNRDITYARERVSDAMVEWGHGRDDNARQALRDAAARLSSQ